MPEFPVQPEQLSTAWFSDTLRDAGVLGADNSVTGFDISYIGDGVGLLGMEERVARLGGALRVESRVGEGTVLSALLPTLGLEPLREKEKLS